MNIANKPQKTPFPYQQSRKKTKEDFFLWIIIIFAQNIKQTPINHMKITVASIIPLLMACIVGSQNANAQDTFEYGDFKYTITGESTVAIAGISSTCTSTVVSAPQNFKYNNHGYTVTSVGEYAFRWSDVTSVTLPNTVDSLQYCAFYSADKLTYVGLPATLKYMGDYCFASTKLTNIILPEGLTEIPNSCFFTVPTLRSITFPSTLKKIKSSSFYKCTGLTEITIPEGCEEIDKAFLYCTNLQRVSLPSTLRVLGDGAFNNCTSLANIDLPSSLESIGEEAFFEDKLLTEISLPRSLKTIGGGAFAKSGLSTISIEEGNTDLKLVDGCVYSNNGKVLALAPMKGLTSHNVAEGCIGIGHGVFWGSELQSIVLPESVAAIDDYAFCQSQLSSINFPFAIRYIGEQALAATRLSKVTLPENLDDISNAVLAGCSSLTELTIPSAVNHVDIRAFWQCTSLKTIHILGQTPPEVEEWYEESENPFFEISGLTVSVPKGTLEAYQNSTWGTTPSNISQIIEGETAIVDLSNIEADGQHDDNGGLLSIRSLTFTFDTNEEITVTEALPRFLFMKDDPVTGPQMKDVVNWKVEKTAKNVATVTPLDASGNAMSVELAKGFNYFLTLPHGEFTTPSATSEHLVIAIAAATPEPIEVLSIDPADGSILEEIEGITLVFDRDIYVENWNVDLSLTKANGEPVEVDYWYALASDTDTHTVTIHPVTVDGWYAYMAPVLLDAGEEYMLNIPAGIIKSKENNAPNPAITLVYQGYDSIPNITPVTITPADGSEASSISSISLTYNEDVAVLAQLPKVVLTSDSINGPAVEVEGWFAQVNRRDNKRVDVVPGYLDGNVFYNEAVEIDPTVTYYVQLPKGICKGNVTGGRSAALSICLNPGGNAIGTICDDRPSQHSIKNWQDGQIRIIKDSRTYNAAGLIIK